MEFQRGIRKAAKQNEQIGENDALFGVKTEIRVKNAKKEFLVVVLPFLCASPALAQNTEPRTPAAPSRRIKVPGSSSISVTPDAISNTPRDFARAKSPVC